MLLYHMWALNIAIINEWPQTCHINWMLVVSHHLQAAKPHAAYAVATCLGHHWWLNGTRIGSVIKLCLSDPKDLFNHFSFSSLSNLRFWCSPLTGCPAQHSSWNSWKWCHNFWPKQICFNWQNYFFGCQYHKTLFSSFLTVGPKS